MVTARLAKFAKVDYDPSDYKGKYRPTHPRQVPDDRLIVETWGRLTNSGWRWVYGMMATYGLRNHEVFRIDFDALRDGDPIIQVLSGKTGSRMVWSFHPEWFNAFALADVSLPNIDVDRDNSAVGHSVTEYLGAAMPFKPYDLRHAYAIRTLSYQIDPSIAARYMGHSREVHERTYRKWIDRALLQREYDRAMAKSDRPLPPMP